MVGTDPDKIINESSQLIDSKSCYLDMARAHNPYGDGKAAERITEFIIKMGDRL